MKFKLYLTILIFSLNIFFISAKNIEQNKNILSKKNNKNVYLKPGIKKQKKKVLPYIMIGGAIIALVYFLLIKKKKVSSNFSKYWKMYNFSTNWNYRLNVLRCSDSIFTKTKPFPNPLNNWDATKIFIFWSKSSDSSYYVELNLEILGCGGIRKDTVYIDDVIVFSKTTKFDNTCDTESILKYKYSEKIYTFYEKREYKIRHVIDLSENSK